MRVANAASMLALAAGLISLGTPAADAAFPGSNGRIVFERGTGAGAEIYSMRFNGTDLRRLTNNSVADGSPAVSADGRRIAFSRTEGGDGDIWVMDADGSNQTEVSSGPGHDIEPSFSPDGNRIVFRRFIGELRIIDVTGANDELITTGLADPAFSPSGSRIAASGPGSSIVVIDPDGGDPQQIAVGGQNARHPSFSPDGTRIAFERQTATVLGGIRNNIRAMTASGSGQTSLTNTHEEFTPAFSPHGGGVQVVFASRRDGNFEIYRMNADGSNQVRLTNSAGFDGHPDWGPAPPPAAQIDFGPSGTTAQTSAVFAFSAPETLMAGPAASFDCSLDGAPFAPCQAPGLQTIPALGDGPHEFRVRGRNATGVGPVEARTWTIDTSEPVPPPPAAEPTLGGLRPAKAKKVRRGKRVRVSAEARNPTATTAVAARLCIALPNRTRKAFAIVPGTAAVANGRACIELGVLEPQSSTRAGFALKVKRRAKRRSRHRLALSLTGVDGASGEPTPRVSAAVWLRVR